jgi:hypothetical protein
MYTGDTPICDEALATLAWINGKDAIIEAQAAQLQEARKLMETIERKLPVWIMAMKDWDQGGEDAVFELRLAEEELGNFLAKS